MLQVAILRKLLVARDLAARAAPLPLSAASGLVRIGRRLHVVADDEHCLAVFDLSDDEPGTLVRVFDEALASSHDERKATKRDLEALAHWPATSRHPFGALLAIGSGSRPNRQVAAWLPLDEHGGLKGPVRHIDLSPMFEILRRSIADLNIEGAFVSGDTLCLLQRGNRSSPVNACMVFDRVAFESWLDDAGPAPVASSITRYELGLIEGVPLCFTDGAALPDGRWVFCAAAEDTTDSYADGRCAGSAVGVVDAAGALELMEPLSLRCKVEGIAASAEGENVRLLMVTDADDRQAPALLLSATLLARRSGETVKSGRISSAR